VFVPANTFKPSQNVLECMHYNKTAYLKARIHTWCESRDFAEQLNFNIRFPIFSKSPTLEPATTRPLTRGEISHCDIILLLIRVHFTRINLCIYAPLWRHNYFESLSLQRWLLPPYFWIRFFDLDRPYVCTI